MSRSPLPSLEANKSLTQLLALNALFDAVRAGAAGCEAAITIKTAVTAANAKDLADPACDALLSNCYLALMDASDRPSRLS